MTSSSAHRLGYLLALSAALELGCEEDHPYTPFQVASALPSAAPPPTRAPPPSPSARVSKFTPARSIKQAKAKQWKIGARTIEAPEGYEIERALEADFDGDGSNELLSWQLPSEDPLLRPELWLHPGAGAPKKLLTLPGFVPTGPTCSLETLFEQSGPETVTLDVRARCEARLIARAPVRSIVVIAPNRDKPVVLALRVAEDGPREDLRMQVSSTDADNDGRDDVTLNLTLTTRESGYKPATARFLWYDREAGASRDDGEPGLSFAQLASDQVVRASGKTTSLAVHGTIQNLKRLYGAVCDEGGTPRLFDAEGNGLLCGRLTTTFARAEQAEVAAFLKNDKPLEAFGALVRDSWFGHPAEPAEIDKRLASFGPRLARKDAKVRTSLSLALPPRGTHPSLSPIEFEAQALLVQTRDGVRRYNFEGAEQTFESGLAPESWPLRVASPAGRLWTGVIQSCDRAELALSYVDGTGAALPDYVTEILAPRPGNCRGGAMPVASDPVPIGWVDEELVAWVGGSFVGPKVPKLRPRGSAQSVNGQWTVLPSALGLLVVGPRLELWALREGATPLSQLYGCTIDDQGRLVACATRNGVLLLEAPAS